jgi:hypothetical protein
MATTAMSGSGWWCRARRQGWIALCGVTLCVAGTLPSHAAEQLDLRIRPEAVADMPGKDLIRNTLSRERPQEDLRLTHKVAKPRVAPSSVAAVRPAGVELKARRVIAASL